ncbi:MAG: DUF4347 domain-containing protein, partial [Burkholderiaceae bacterium]|nr:DUF4347 domain-containing protein [Burkholderiaceae bacterium]
MKTNMTRAPRKAPVPSFLSNLIKRAFGGFGRRVDKPVTLRTPRKAAGRQAYALEAIEPRMLLSATLDGALGSLAASTLSNDLVGVEINDVSSNSGVIVDMSSRGSVQTFGSATTSGLSVQADGADDLTSAEQGDSTILGLSRLGNLSGAALDDGALSVGKSVSQIVFVDTRVQGYEALIDSLNLDVAADGDLRVVMLDADRDALEQISGVLAEHSGLAAVHILSHGSSGSLQLGNSTLDQDNLGAYADTVAAWGDALSENADILLYGCDVAQGQWGIAFVDKLAALTGADVAASNDLTGAATLGGDWVLEASTGVIDAGVLTLATYQGLLVSEAGATATAQLSDLSTISQTFLLADGVKTLDLTVFDKNLLVTVTKTPQVAGKYNIKVQEMNAATGAAVGSGSATYTIKADNGKVGGLVLGHAGKKVKLVLDKVAIDTLDLSKVSALPEVAIGGNDDNGAKTFGWLTQAAGVAIVTKGSAAKVDTLKIGAPGSATDVELFIGIKDKVAKLAKGDVGFTGKLKLNYPEALSGLSTGTGTGPGSYVDLARTPMSIQGIGTLEGFTSAAAAKEFIKEIKASDGKQKITLSATPDVTVTTGEDDDTLIGIGGSTKQTFVGGEGNDTYKFADNWGADTVTEMVNEGRGDHLDFSAVSGAGISVDVYSSQLPSGATPSPGQNGVQVVQTGTPANKLDDAAFIEKISGGTGNNVYKFHNDWGYFSTTELRPATAFFTINNAGTPHNATLDFSAVTHDLVFKLEDAGTVTVTAKVSVTPSGASAEKLYTYEVKAEGIASIVGGKGVNTYQITHHDKALLGGITTPNVVGAANVLDYSLYSTNQAIVVDQAAGAGLAATGLKKFEPTLAK